MQFSCSIIIEIDCTKDGQLIQMNNVPLRLCYPQSMKSTVAMFQVFHEESYVHSPTAIGQIFMEISSQTVVKLKYF
jgi:hypothetical protein